MSKKTLAEQLATTSINQSVAAVAAAEQPTETTAETVQMLERTEHAQAAAQTALNGAVAAAETTFDAQAVLAAKEALVVAQTTPLPVIDHAAAMEKNLDAAAVAERALDEARLLAHREALTAYQNACDQRLEYDGDDEQIMTRLIRAKKAARVVLDAAAQAIDFTLIIKAINPLRSRIPQEGIALKWVEGELKIVNAPILVENGGKSNGAGKAISPSPNGSSPSPSPNGLRYIVQWPHFGDDYPDSGKAIAYPSLNKATAAIHKQWGSESPSSGNTFWKVPTGYHGAPGEVYSKNYKGWTFTLTIQ